ncbi:hypothetical protein DDZ18_05425 [Marinicauda salina]|uniref:DUF2165 domain-containing protein n=1 Tax=Marinicauda salina TaxID=2135793 RepID=A0A2U2BVG9_9PROT|nr:DUF2165 family protein [Marinicauda salina]PWE18013.1 hypothetical protein DDZ18_05425 [Marinicauda salina]
MIRYLKILLILLVALWGLIGAFGNLAKPDVAYDAVAEVAAMEALPAGERPPWATQSPTVIWLGATLIVAGKIAAFVFCGGGAIAMLRAVNADSAGFQRAKRWALLGCGLAVASLFGGFTVIGETLFLMFLDEGTAQAGAAAFRYGGFIALIMIFTALED